MGKGEKAEAETAATYVQLDGLISWAQRQLGDLPAIRRKEKIRKLVEQILVKYFIRKV